jgi:PilZ domain-containing protein
MAIWDWLSSRVQAGQSPIAGKGSGSDRRTAQRFSSTRVKSCSMIKLPASIPLTVELKDISVGGIGLISQTNVEPGAFLVITLLGAHHFVRTLQARTVHSTQHSKKVWVIGCILTRELTAQELEAFL